MPLDIAAHVRLPDWLWRHARLAPDLTQRMLGSMCAALMSIAAFDVARTLGARGGVAVAVVATVCAGGELALFTGYGKGLAELTALTGVAAALALRALRDPRALPALALAVAVALGFHRAGLLLLPFTLVAIALSWRGVSGRYLALTIGILVAPLVVLGPRMASVLMHFDLPHHIAPAGPPLAGARDPWQRACDLANAALVLAPLCPLIPALAPSFARSPIGNRALLVTWLLSAIALFAVVQPQQGVFRDLDVFAPAAVLLSASAAVGIAGWAARRPASAALAPALTLATLAPTVLWLCVQHWPERSLPRIEAFASGPPLRPAAERAAIWDFLGTRALADRRPQEAARDFEQAAGAAASPRLLYQWGTAEVVQGNLARADSLFRLSVARDPDFTPAWRGLASTGSWLGDTLVCAQAERRLSALDPSAPELPALRAYLARARATGGRR
jgi:tetratricopeptide (TPR) repeat protein